MTFESFDFLYEYFRNFIGILVWIWALFVFMIEYYGDFGDLGNNGRPLGFRDVFSLLVKVLIVAPIAAGEGNVGLDPAAPFGRHLAPANVQYMGMNPDGQYSFAYTSAESSRQERRNSDGTVVGKYTYTDPNGKIVQVDYTADSNGFQAYGDNVPAPPTQVQDTQAVKEARQRFLTTYAREYARAQAQSQMAKEVATSITKETDKSVNVASDVVAVQHEVLTDDTTGEGISSLDKYPDSSQETHSAEIFDSKIIQRDTTRNPSQNSAPKNLVVPTSKPQAGPGYFYYVGVGGQPYYVPSPVRSNTNVAVSVRASQMSSIPISGVHDAQVPHYGNRVQNHVSQPLYVEIGKDYELPTTQYQYGLLGNQNFGFRKTYAGPTKPSHYGSATTVFTLPYFGYPAYIY